MLGKGSLGLVIASILAACSGSGGTTCVCSSTEFCCLGACQPLGTVCGAVDGGGEDDGHVASDGGSDAGPVDAGPVCSSPCNDGYACIAWTDTTSGTVHDDCLPTGSVPCDPMMSGSTHCDGATRVTCDAFGGFPDTGPPGLEHRSDCTVLFGAAATCVADPDGTTRCAGTTCDPATYVPSCDAAHDDVALSCDTSSDIVRYDTCQPMWRCLVNEWTLAGGAGATCIPRIAVVSSLTPTSAWTPLACDGTDAIHVEQYGYEWSERCRTGEACFTFPASVGGAPARCLPASTVTCDPTTFVPSCDAAGTSEQACQLGVVTPRYCGVPLLSGSLPSACDDATGACVPTGFCSPAGAPAHCSTDGRFRLTCNTDWVRELAERCTCTTDTTGAAVCS